MSCLLAAALLLAAPSRGDEGQSASGEQVYRMNSAQQIFGEKEWREFQRRHDREIERVQRMNERYGRQAWQVPVQPVYSSPAPRRPSGPSGPGVIRDFKDDFASAVNGYITAHSKDGDGVLVLDDDATGRRYRLKLSHMHTERIRRLATDLVSGDVSFLTVDAPKTAVDLDFNLGMEEGWAWTVKKVLIRTVNGKPRYAYDGANKIVGATAPAAAPREIPKPTAPARLSAEVSFVDPDSSGALDGGETAELKIKVVNAGPGAAYAAKLSIDPRNAGGVTMPSELELGDLEAGKSVTKEVPIAAADDLRAGKLEIRLAINEANGFDTEPVLVQLETRAGKPPKLQISDIMIAGTGIVAAGEATKIAVRIKNAGTGPARGVSASLALGSPDLFMSGEPAAALGDLDAGQTKTAEFEFFANKRIKAGEELPVSLSLTEASGRHGLPQTPLRLVVGKGAPEARVVSIAGLPETAPAPVEDVDSPPASRTRRDEDSYAVVVGIEKYRDVPSADFAARDAGTMQDYLTEAMGYDPKNVILLQNERATLTDMSTYLGPWLKDHATKKSRVFVYYAGHGAVDPKTGRSFLIPYDGDPAYTDTKAFPLQQLYDALAQLPSRQITVALDACFSGAGGRSVIAKGTRPLVTTVAAAAIAPRIVVLSASGGDQISTDVPDAQHGMLTYYLLKGLRGAAADSSGRVTTRRLFEYVQPAVERAARERHVEQSPQLHPAPDQLGDEGARIWLQTR